MTKIPYKTKTCLAKACIHVFCCHSNKYQTRFRIHNRYQHKYYFEILNNRNLKQMMLLSFTSTMTGATSWTETVFPFPSKWILSGFFCGDRIAQYFGVCFLCNVFLDHCLSFSVFFGVPVLSVLTAILLLSP